MEVVGPRPPGRRGRPLLADAGARRATGDHAPRGDQDQEGEAEQEQVGIDAVVDRGADQGPAHTGQPEDDTGTEADPATPPVRQDADE